MNSSKTLHELCDALGVSRRAVQGYEKEGLVAASGKNKYGHLLYDEKSQERIAQIRLYQQFGFKVKEIKYLIEAPDCEVREAIKRQVSYLQAERARIDALIDKAYELLDAAKTNTNISEGGKNL